MAKTITFIGVMLAAGLITLHFVDDSKPQTDMTREFYVFDEETTNLAVTYRCFKDTFEQALLELETGDITLAAATDRVYGSAKQFCPLYLRRVGISDPATTLEASIALNLVGHVRSLEEVRPTLATRVAELETEMQNIANQSESRSVR